MIQNERLPIESAPNSSAVLKANGIAHPLSFSSPATVTANASGASSPFGYGNLPSGFNWTQMFAPTTNDKVYTGTYNNQVVYVGPDNQPWIGGKGDFFYSNGNRVNPIPGKATKISWAQLGVTNANPNVYESTYAGQGADSPSKNDLNYGGLPSGENLVVGSGSVSNNNPTLPIKGTPVPRVGSNPGTTQAAGGLLPDTGPGSPSGDNTDVTTQLLQDIAAAEAANAQAGSQGIPGSGSTAADIPVVGNNSSSSSGPASSIALVAIVGVIALAVIWFFVHKKKKGGESGSSSSAV